MLEEFVLQNNVCCEKSDPEELLPHKWNTLNSHLILFHFIKVTQDHVSVSVDEKQMCLSARLQEKLSIHPSRRM